MLESSGPCYNHVMIANDDTSIISKWSFKLIDDPRVIIYDRHRFIVQATDLRFEWNLILILAIFHER